MTGAALEALYQGFGVGLAVLFFSGLLLGFVSFVRRMLG